MQQASRRREDKGRRQSDRLSDGRWNELSRRPATPLDDPGDADRHFVLKFENVFERVVEAVGPKMRAGAGVDQLTGNAHATAPFADRAFEDVADTEFMPDPLHVNRLALVGKARIARDDEEPANARERGNDLLDERRRRNTPAPDRR